MALRSNCARIVGGNMVTRREFIGSGASAMASAAFVGCDLFHGAHAHAQGLPVRRREVALNGRRIKTVDIHAHLVFSEALDLMGLKPNPPSLVMSADRLRDMDEQGIDVAALSINPFWYKADRDRAKAVIKLQNEKLAELCGAQPDRFVAFATMALQYPDLAVAQLEDGIKRLGLRGVSVGGHVEGIELADPKFHPVWAKAEELGCLVFIHPVRTPEFERRLAGNGDLMNIVGFPLDTSIALSHLIFEGTLDRVPRIENLRIARRRLSGVLCTPIGRGLHQLSGTLHGRTAEEKANRISPTDLLRLDHLHAGSDTPFDRRSRRRSDHARHRCAIPLEQGCGGPHPRHAGRRRRRTCGDAGRHGSAPAADRTVTD
jgi:predicted TIM-barrel fold metal-dependent hydrolase